MIESIYDNAIEKKLHQINLNNKKAQETSSFNSFFSMQNKDQKKEYQFPSDNDFGYQFTNQNISDKKISTLKFRYKSPHSNKAVFLGKNNITDIGFIELAKTIKHDKIIKHLILSHNSIRFNEFAKAGLADLLKINRHIGWLVLNNNEIDNRGATNLAAALINNQSVKHLVLSENKIQDDGLLAILKSLFNHPKIESLFVANNKITYKSTQAISDLISESKTLKRIDISAL